MTIQSPEAEEQSPAPKSRGRRATDARARRAHDYRLRGLDLEAQALIEARPRTIRKNHPSLRRRRLRLFVQWVAVLTVLASVAVLLRASVFEPFSVSSASMVPTLQKGTDVLVVKPSFLTGSMKAGNIIVFHEPTGFSCTAAGDDSRHLVKRVIGLPGQTIWSVGESIYVNGHRLNEPGWYNQPFGEVGPTPIARTTIPPGSYFVMGDNRTDSCDSRSFGPIPKSSLIGRVVATITRNGHPFVHSI